MKKINIVKMISPKLEKDTVDFGLLDSKFDFNICLLSLYFQNLNKNPTVKLAKICVKNKTRPIVVLPKRAIPTVPIIKSGPELFVKVISLSASSFVQMPFFLKLVTILAPTGYPAYNTHY